MKKLKELFKKREGADMYRPGYREYMERHVEAHGAQYIIIAITLAVSAILAQAVWSVYSLVK